jgi:hypothetical protein
MTVGGTSLVDLVAVAIGAVTMIAAFALAIFGYRITHDYSNLHARLLKCEKTILDDAADLKSLRALSALFANLLAESHVFADILRRAIEDFGTGDQATRERRKQALMQYTAESLDRFSRVGSYVALLDVSRETSFDDKLDELISKYPDKETITFLQSIQSLLTPEEETILGQHLPNLAVRVLGVDYTRWTSIRYVETPLAARGFWRRLGDVFSPKSM